METLAALLIGFIGIAGFVTFFMVIMTLLNGWVLSCLWGWFVVPVFHLPPLTIVQCIGLAFVVAWARGVDTSEKSSDKKAMARAVLSPVVSKLLLVGMAWIFQAIFL